MSRTSRFVRSLCAAAVIALVAPATTSQAAPAKPAPGRGSPPSKRGDFPFEKTMASEVRYVVGATLRVGDGTEVADAVIRIAGGRIDRVEGAAARGSIPDGADVIDATGKIVTPGFIAADTSLGLTEIGAEDSTNDRGRDSEHLVRAGHDVSTAINAESSLLPVAALSGVTSAAVTPSGGLLAGQVAWIDMVFGDHAGIVSAANIAQAGSIGQRYGGSRAATLAKLEQTLFDARFLRTRGAAYDRRQVRDLAAHPRDLAALNVVLDGRVPLVVHAHRASDMLAMIGLAQRYGVDLVVLGGTQAWKVADELAAADVTVIVQPSQNLPGGFDRLGARFDNAALLHAAGVRVGIARLGEAHNVRNVSQEAGLAVSYGLDPKAALTAITLNIARAYGMDADYGSVAAGKVANVVVWDGDPFELSSAPTAVLVRGRPVPMVSRQTLLRDRYLDLSRFARPPVDRR